MKNKSLSLLVLGILSLFLIAGFASATITLTPSTTTLPRTNNSFDINVTSDVNETITLSNTAITQDGKTITFLYDTTPINSTAGIPNPVHVTYTINDFSFHLGKTYSTTFNANGTVSPDATKDFSFEVATPNEFPNYGGNLQLNIDDIIVEEGFGEDTDWFPMDEIKVDIEVRNDGNKEIRDIVVEWGLYDVENGNWIVKDKEKDFDLDEDEEKVLNLQFQLDKDALDEIDTDASNYKFYAWATGEDEDNSWNETSTYDSEEIDMQIESDFVVLDNIEISESASCGSEVQINADVWNIGDRNQDDVSVVIYNKELGINKKVTVGDIDSFDDSRLEVTITIPETAEEKSYPLQFSVYDEDDETYQNGNDDDAEFSSVIDVTGSCSVTPKVAVVANLETESAVAGKEITIKAVITNTGAKTSTYLLNTVGYTDWASELNLDKNSLTLDAGESEEVLIKLIVNKDIAGEKEFSIELVEGNNVFTQPVKVEVEKSSLFPDLTGFVTGIAGDNWYLWGIGALNVLLVLVIIVVAAKVAKKKE